MWRGGRHHLPTIKSAPPLLLLLLQIVEAWKDLGVHPGTKFRSWMDDRLKDQLQGNNGTSARDFTVADLLARLKLPDATTIWARDDGTPVGAAFASSKTKDLTAQTCPKPPTNYGAANWAEYEWPLKLVAAELKTQSKIVFPQDAPLFYVSGSMVCDARELRWAGCLPGEAAHAAAALCSPCRYTPCRHRTTPRLLRLLTLCARR